MKINHKEETAVIGRTVELNYRELELIADKLQAFKAVTDIIAEKPEDNPRGYTVVNALSTQQKDNLVKSVVDIIGFINQIVQDVEPSTVVEDKLFGRQVSDELVVRKTT